MLSGSIMAVLVNRDPIYGFAVFIREVGVAFMVLHVNAVIEDLTEPDRDRFQNAEEAIQQPVSEVRIVNEVMRDAIDVPGDANGIDEAQDQHEPHRRSREKVEHSKKVGAM